MSGSPELSTKIRLVYSLILEFNAQRHRCAVAQEAVDKSLALNSLPTEGQWRDWFECYDHLARLKDNIREITQGQ